MRTVPSLQPTAFKVPRERKQFKRVGDTLRQVNGALSRSILSGQTPPANNLPSSKSAKATATTAAALRNSGPLNVPIKGDLMVCVVDGVWSRLPSLQQGASGFLESVGNTISWGLGPGEFARQSTDFVTNTPDDYAPNGQALSLLATGLLKNTTGTGILSIADATDLPAHASRHQSGGADPIALDTLAAPSDNATLNASTSAHGLLRKLNNDTTQFLRGDGVWAAATTTPSAADELGKTGNIGTTNLIASTSQTGMYRVSVYLKVTTGGNPGDYIQITLGWNDGGAYSNFVMMNYDQAGLMPTTAPSLGTTGHRFDGTQVLYATSSTAITYATTVTKTGSPVYDLRLRAELIG